MSGVSEEHLTFEDEADSPPRIAARFLDGDSIEPPAFYFRASFDSACMPGWGGGCSFRGHKIGSYNRHSINFRIFPHLEVRNFATTLYRTEE